MTTLKDRTIIITGSSRGIGRAIALRCASEGANIVIAAKSAEPHPKLPGTIFSVAEEVEAAGGHALPVQVDVRSEEKVQSMVDQTVEKFGGVDALINNAGAISLTDLASTSMKKYDLMQNINVRASYLCAKVAMPHLKKSENAHIINMSPPVSLKPKWIGGHSAYTISKFGMSLVAIGLAEEYKEEGVSVNALWPKTAIATAAIDMLLGDAGRKHSRTPEIMADAVAELLKKGPGEVTGQTLIEEEFLQSCGYSDFDKYQCVPGEKLFPDFYVEPWE